MHRQLLQMQLLRYHVFACMVRLWRPHGRRRRDRQFQVYRMSDRRMSDRLMSDRLMSDRLDLANYLPYLVNRLGSALVASFTATVLAQHDLNIDAWRVMAVLANRGAQRQIDLAALTSIDVSTLSRLVTRMVRIGLVTRRRSQASNREVVVELSAKGRGLVSRIIPLARRLEATAAQGIAAKEMVVVKRTLRRMFENMAQGYPAGARIR
jgi:MarR family transcriptional regulator, organic hydroperoxide resistance regulator